MGTRKVEFVNLAKARMEAVPAAARLAAFHYRNGRRVLILARDQAESQDLDQTLWTLEPDSFIPHALAGGPDQGEEPVLIALESRNINQARVLILTRPLKHPPLKDFSHLVQLVPAQDGPELNACRDLYRRLQKQGGVELIHTTRIP